MSIRFLKAEHSQDRATACNKNSTTVLAKFELKLYERAKSSRPIFIPKRDRFLNKQYYKLRLIHSPTRFTL
jgi:hypothetical protein